MERATNERTHARLRLVVKNFLSASKSRWPDFFAICHRRCRLLLLVSLASSFIFILVSICVFKKILRRIFASRAEDVFFFLLLLYKSKNSEIFRHFGCFSRQQLKCRENDGRSSRRERLSEWNKYRKKSIQSFRHKTWRRLNREQTQVNVYLRINTSYTNNRLKPVCLCSQSMCG